MRTKIFLENMLSKMRGNGSMQEAETLRESDALLRVIFDQSSLLMGIMKPDGTVLKINPTAYGYIKGEEAEVIGKFFWETPWWTHVPEQQERLRDAVKTAASGEYIRFEATHRAPDGMLHYIDFSIKPVKDEKGNVVLLLPEGRDITERKLAEEALRESDALLRVIFDQATHLMGLTKPDGTVIKTNPTAFGFIKGMESEVIGKLFWETPWWAHSPEQQERLREAIKAAARGEFVRFEATNITSEGKLIYVDFSLKPVKNEKGDVVLLVPEGYDITERKRAEEALREAAVKYRIVADNTYNWEFWLSPEGRFIYTSPSCQRISGHEADEFSADPGLIWKIIHPDDRQLWADHRHNIIQTKVQGDIDVPYHPSRRRNPLGPPCLPACLRTTTEISLVRVEVSLISQYGNRPSRKM